MYTKSNFFLLLVLLGIACVTGCGPDASKPVATAYSQESTDDSVKPKRPLAAVIEVPQDVVEAITKERIVKPAPSPTPTAAEIADWSPPKGPAFELVFQHRVGRGGPILAHPDGKSFFHAGDRLARWKIGSDEPQKVYHNSSASNITAVAIIKNENKLIAGDDLGTLRIWDIDSGELLSTRKQKLGKKHRSISPVAAVAASPDGKTIATIAEYDPVEFYDSMLQPKEMPDIKSRHSKLFFLDDNLLVLSGEGTEVWSIQTNEQIARFESKPLLYGPKATPAGSSFVYKTLDGLKQWNRDEPDALLGLPNDGYSPNALIYSPDGNLVVQAGGGRLEIIDVASQKRRQIWDAPPMTGIGWIPDSNLLVTTTAKGLISVIGTPESASSYGLNPIVAIKVAPSADTSIPPTTAQLKAIIDLRTLPKLPRFVPTTDYHYTSWYQTPADVAEVRKFYRHVLGVRGWKEVAAEQQGLIASNLRFEQNGHVLILDARKTRRHRSWPKNLIGVKPGSQITNNEKVTDISMSLAEYFDMRTLPIYGSTSWELVDEQSGYLRYRTSDSIVACELALLRMLPPAGWAYLSNNGSNLSFVKNGCVLSTSIQPEPSKKGSLAIIATCRVRMTMLIPPDSEFLSLGPLKSARSKLSISDLRANFDSQMQEDGWTNQRLDTEGLHRNIYSKGLQDVTYRFDVDGSHTVVTEEPHREFVWRNAKSSKQEIRAVNFPTPGAVAPPQYGRVVDRTKAIEFVSSKSWEQLRTAYSDFLGDRGYEGKVAKKEMDTCYFKNDRRNVRIKFEPHAEGLSVIIDGKLKWPYPLPSETPILRDYSNWLEIKGRDFSLDHLDEFEVEMLKILDQNNQTKSPEG